MLLAPVSVVESTYGLPTICRATLGAALVAAPLAGQVLRQENGGRAPESYCTREMLRTRNAMGKGGRIACAKDPARPAILLVHGLHQSITTWTMPSAVGFS